MKTLTLTLIATACLVTAALAATWTFKCYTDGTTVSFTSAPSRDPKCGVCGETMILQKR